METSREKYFVQNTMVCLLKAVEGKITTVELRDEKEAIGKITHVDGYMNITMENVTLKNAKTGEKHFEQFFVNGKTIRYVHIPDEIDMKRAMENKLKQYCSSTQALRVKQEIQDHAWARMKKREAATQKLMDKQHRADIKKMNK